MYARKLITVPASARPATGAPLGLFSSALYALLATLGHHLFPSNAFAINRFCALGQKTGGEGGAVAFSPRLSEIIHVVCKKR